MRIALLTEIPAPFRIPLWNALADAPDVTARVLLLREHDPRRQYAVERNDWRFDGRVLAGSDILVRGRWLVLSRGVEHELAEFAPDVLVLGGWNQPAFWSAATYARRRHLPFVLWVESTERDVRPGTRNLERLKRSLVRRAAAFLVPGRAAADYVQRLGAADEKVVVAPNAVDPGFTAAVDAARRRRDELRAQLGLSRVTFLCVSRLSPEKGVDLLLRASRGVEADLVVIGDGPMREQVARTAPPNARLLGGLPADELPRWYAAADAFVLASRSETWGMALAEAAAAGLPLVATDAVGGAADLIDDGANELVVPSGDEQRLRSALERVAGDEELRSRAAAQARELGRCSTPADWAEAVVGVGRKLVEEAREPADWDQHWRVEPVDTAAPDHEERTPRWRAQERLVHERFGSFAGLKVVELGAGRGLNGVLYARRGASVTLVDASALALEQARQLFDAHDLSFEPVVGDLFQSLDGLARGFDVAMSFGLCEHFVGERRVAVVRAHLELLRPGGLAFLGVPNSLAPAYRLWMAAMKARGTWPLGIEEPFSPAELAALARRAGGRPLQPAYGSALASIVDHGVNQLLHKLGRRPLPTPQVRLPLVDRLAYELLLPVEHPE